MNQFEFKGPHQPSFPPFLTPQVDPDLADLPAPPPGAKNEAPFYEFDKLTPPSLPPSLPPSRLTLTSLTALLLPPEPRTRPPSMNLMIGTRATRRTRRRTWMTWPSPFVISRMRYVGPCPPSLPPSFSVGVLRFSNFLRTYHSLLLPPTLTHSPEPPPPPSLPPSGQDLHPHEVRPTLLRGGPAGGRDEGRLGADDGRQGRAGLRLGAGERYVPPSFPPSLFPGRDTIAPSSSSSLSSPLPDVPTHTLFASLPPSLPPSPFPQQIWTTSSSFWRTRTSKPSEGGREGGREGEKDEDLLRLKAERTLDERREGAREGGKEAGGAMHDREEEDRHRGKRKF